MTETTKTRSLKQCCQDALQRLDDWRQTTREGRRFYVRRTAQVTRELGHPVEAEVVVRWDAQIATLLGCLDSKKRIHVLRPDIRKWILGQLVDSWRQLVTLLLEENVELDPVRQEWRFALWAAFPDGRPASPFVPTPSPGTDRSAEILDVTEDPLERLLVQTDPQQRVRYGAYFTPPSVADFILQEVDQQLRLRFGLPLGLADTTRWAEWPEAPARAHPGESHFFGENDAVVTILDPAAGSGVFLTQAIRHIFRVVRQQGRGTAGEKLPQQDWTNYVARNLLPRLCGFELLPPAYVACVVNIALTLAEQGVAFDPLPRLDIRLGNTLECEQLSRRFTVVVGNPPFSGISNHHGAWIRGLMKGHCEATQQPWANYYEVAGEPLGERKVWIDDDYVKFLRFAHWQIERQGVGVVGLITNHGYVDNASFRGVRYQLLRTFPHARIVNLHGNAKRSRVDLDGQADENIFEIEQGVAVGIFARPPSPHGPPGTHSSRSMVEYAEIRGRRIAKLQGLQRLQAGAPHCSEPHCSSRQAIPNGLNWTAHTPSGPHFLFRPRTQNPGQGWQQARTITEWMPQNSTVPVTARDHFVTDRCRGRLVARLREFADLSIADEAIRAKYFGRSRSRKYPAGDTRGWQLAEARRAMALLDDVDRYIIPCAYRPFEHRFIFWTDWMVDWHRPAVSQHFLRGPNLALITRRQMLPDRPSNYFWVSDRLPLDGIIRSDNRGSESFFPLWIYTDAGRRQANFCDSLAEPFAERMGRHWDPGSPTNCPQTVSAESLFGYIYALFHSARYRQQFAEELAHDFPRVLPPESSLEFDRLANIGTRLVQAHTGFSRDTPTELSGRTGIQWSGKDRKLRTGFPQFAPLGESGCIRINESSQILGVAERVWSYRVGTHHVCRKWLRDRRHAELTQPDIDRFCQILATLQMTLEAVEQIDRSNLNS